MKTILLILLTLNLNFLNAQHDWFFSAGFDPAIATNLPKLNGEDRVGGGNLNYLLQVGKENYVKGNIGYKFGIQYEDFKAINYKSGGVFGGITFEARYIPFTDIQMGDFWYLTAELNLIERRGIKDSRVWNADKVTNWAFGINAGLTFREIFNLPFNLDFLINGKDRADIRTHYTGGKFDSINDIVVSGYLLITLNF